MRAGQELVFGVLDALVQSPAWERTLLVLTYDEHGGFFDDVEPPSAEDDDPRPDSLLLDGPRVPAIVVSARVRPGAVGRALRPHVDHQDMPCTLLRRREAG